MLKLKGYNPYTIRAKARLAFLIFWRRLRGKDARYDKNLGVKITRMVPVVFVVGEVYDFGLHAINLVSPVRHFKFCKGEKKCWWEAQSYGHTIGKPLKPCKTCFRPSVVLEHRLGGTVMRCLCESRESEPHENFFQASKDPCCYTKDMCFNCAERIRRDKNWQFSVKY